MLAVWISSVVVQVYSSALIVYDVAGAAESGKSTFAKQMKYGVRFTYLNPLTPTVAT